MFSVRRQDEDHCGSHGSILDPPLPGRHGAIDGNSDACARQGTATDKIRLLTTKTVMNQSGKPRPKCPRAFFVRSRRSLLGSRFETATQRYVSTNAFTHPNRAPPLDLFTDSPRVSSNTRMNLGGTEPSTNAPRRSILRESARK